MAEQTNISWADATLNFWIGCTKVSPACDNCYAEAWGNRFGVKWGPHEERRITKGWEAKIKAILRQAAKDGIARPFVFVNSLSDFWDNAVDPAVRRAAFALMRRYPQVIFLLLTKRPGNIAKLFAETITPEVRAELAKTVGLGLSLWPPNVAMGCTVVNQEEADRDIPKLLFAKAGLKPAFAFVSMEPLLGGVEMVYDTQSAKHDYLTGHWYEADEDGTAQGRGVGLDWVITGGESGPKARPSDPAWFASLRDQCARASVAYHHKQNGEWTTAAQMWRAHGDTAIGPDRFSTFTEVPGVSFERWGKARTGRMLDGEIHDARPKVAA